MFKVVTQFDTEISVSIALGFIFIIWLIYMTPNNNTLTNKYKRLDYFGSLFFFFWLATCFLFSKIWLFDKLWSIGAVPTLMYVGVVFMTLWFLWSWTINVHFRKEISSDTAYKFWVSSFISGWIAVFYLIIEWLR